MRKVVHASATTALLHSIQWHEGNRKLVIDYEIYDTHGIHSDHHEFEVEDLASLYPARILVLNETTLLF